MNDFLDQSHHTPSHTYCCLESLLWEGDKNSKTCAKFYFDFTVWQLLLLHDGFFTKWNHEFRRHFFRIKKLCETCIQLIPYPLEPSSIDGGRHLRPKNIPGRSMLRKSSGMLSRSHSVGIIWAPSLQEQEKWRFMTVNSHYYTLLFVGCNSAVVPMINKTPNPQHEQIFVFFSWVPLLDWVQWINTWETAAS